MVVLELSLRRPSGFDCQFSKLFEISGVDGRSGKGSRNFEIGVSAEYDGQEYDIWERLQGIEQILHCNWFLDLDTKMVDRRRASADYAGRLD